MNIRGIGVMGMFALCVACSDTTTPNFDGASETVVDSALSDYLPLEVSVDAIQFDFIPTADDRCGGGTTIGFPQKGQSEPVVFTGNTTEMRNDYVGIRCGGTENFDGPQQYYRMPMDQGVTYRFLVDATFEAVLYLFSSCDPDFINSECSSGGEIGAVTSLTPQGEKNELFFTAPSTGTFLVAVDSRSESERGSFTLTVEQFFPPTNRFCALAHPLAWQDGRASIQGTTIGASDEFSPPIECGVGLGFDGPQVYYNVNLDGNTWYKISLLASFPAGVYGFNAAGGCKRDNIELDCGSLFGTVMVVLDEGMVGETAFFAPSTGTYQFAVDGVEPNVAGDFTFTVESYSPTENMVCEAATSLLFQGIRVEVNGTTDSFLNDRGAHHACYNTPRLLGPQAYYHLTLDAVPYRATLESSFNAVLAIGSSCPTMAIDCGSGGISGTFLSVLQGTTASTIFTPPTAGTYLFAVEGIELNERGSFRLAIEEHTLPTNGVCGTPAPIAVSSSSVTVAGNTGSLKNDLDPVDCGSGVTWRGPQAYYRLAIPAGKTALLELQPEASFDGALYAFKLDPSVACNAQSVSGACVGLWSDKIGDGVAESLAIHATDAANYMVVVDSWSASAVGSFSLTVTMQ